MAINLMQGLLTAVILQPRHPTTNQLVSASALSAITPGVLGMLMPLLLVKPAPATAPSPPAAPAGPVVLELDKVPDVVGQTEANARGAFKGLDFEIEVRQVNLQGSAGGTVIAQDPTGNTLLEKGSTVVLSVQQPTACGPAAA